MPFGNICLLFKTLSTLETTAAEFGNSCQIQVAELTTVAENGDYSL